jgi:hypothetical protein
MRPYRKVKFIWMIFYVIGEQPEKAAFSQVSGTQARTSRQYPYQLGCL